MNHNRINALINQFYKPPYIPLTIKEFASLFNITKKNATKEEVNWIENNLVLCKDGMIRICKLGDNNG